MEKSFAGLMCTVCVVSILLFGCKKEVFDVTTTEVQVPSVDEIAAVDCPEFMLDIGEPCTIGDQMGIVTIDCECIEADAVEVVSVEFINDTGGDVVVTVETSPAFLAGSTYAVVPAVGITLSYHIPVGTNVFSLGVYYACADVGVASESASLTSPSSVGGSLVQVHVDCP